MSQRSQDPTFHLQNPRLHFRLVLSFPDPGRDNDSAIMLGQLSVSGVEVGFIAAGPGDRILQIVWGEDLRGPLEAFESTDMRLNPGGQILGKGSLRKGIVAGPQGGHKDLSCMDLSGLGICDLHRLPGVIDEELFSGLVNLSETGVELLCPLMINSAKLTVLVAIKVLLFILMPEKLKGNALPL
jgi:hypothetical protein